MAERKKESLNIRITRSLLKRVREASLYHNVSIAEITAQALEDYLEYLGKQSIENKGD